jgi:hypothetical protein
MKLELRLLAAGFLLLILIAASCHQKAAACDAAWRAISTAHR